MVDSYFLIEAMNGVHDEQVVLAGQMLGYFEEKEGMRPHRRLWSTLLVAAIIISLFTGVAYAANLFGIQALLTKKEPSSENPNGGYLSFSQPQELPEGMDSTIREKIDNSTNAWAEWMEWISENGLSIPGVYDPPEGTSFLEETENEDGTYTLRFYSYPDKPLDASVLLEHMQRGDYSDLILLDERIATKEERDRDIEVEDARARGFGDYDYPYYVYTQEMADQLEGIASRYGLRLRHKKTSMFQNYNGQTEYFTREEITTKINEICCGGKPFFRSEPTGYDKFYYFDEGTFAISFYTSNDLTNAGTRCYLYNSPYGTLSSGFEIFEEVKDISGFSVRSHTTPDGTELTVLQNGSDMYAYVYLDSSFVTLHIMQLNGLSEAEIDAILDMMNFSYIG